jgi:hypothetical protein
MAKRTPRSRHTSTKPWLSPPGIGPGHDLDLVRVDRELLQGGVEDFDVIAGGVRPGVAADSGRFRTPVLVDSVQRFWGFSYTPGEATGRDPRVS